MVFCAIMVEEIMSHYLLIEIEQDQAPKQTEEESKINTISRTKISLQFIDNGPNDHIEHSLHFSDATLNRTICCNRPD